LDRPLTWADFNNSAAPADEINDSPPDSTPTARQRLRFTYGVPFSYLEQWTFDKPIFPCWTGTSVHYAPNKRTIIDSTTKDRG
jgi:hypothetical protein